MKLCVFVRYLVVGFIVPNINNEINKASAFSTTISFTNIFQRTKPLHISNAPTSKYSKESLNDVSTDAIICGGGPAGLLSAIMLAQKNEFRKIKVYDRLSEPPSPTDESVWNDLARFYLIGLGGRGQIALSKFGVWEDVEKSCTAVKGRKDWAPGSLDGVERIFEGRKFDTQVLPRDKLVGVLYRHVIENYADRVEVYYGYDAKVLDFDDGKNVLVEISKCHGQTEKDLECDVDDASTLVSTKLLIAADGTSRTIANQMEEKDKRKLRSMQNPIRRLYFAKQKAFRVTRYEDDNQRVYKTIPMNLLNLDWRVDLNYSARSEGGRVNLDALPANKNGGYCAVLLLKKDDAMAQPNADPREFKRFLDDYLPQFSFILDDEIVAQVAKKPPSYLPSFRYVSPRLNQGGNTLILGDCAHTVKPYFGLGANSAFEDVKMLSDVIDTRSNRSDVSEAVYEFSKRRSKDAKTLVRISRDLDRPGTLGTLTFLIPIILDALFNNIAPGIFSPNIISMLQREDLTFSQVARRKRLDRLLQLTLISTTMIGMTNIVIRSILKITAQLNYNWNNRKGITMLIPLGCFAVFSFRKLFSLLVPGMAPADALVKTRSKISNNESIMDFAEQDKFA